MKYGFCHLSVIPLRKETCEASEMVSQVLFGDVFEIISSTGKWSWIRLAFDQYEGWIDNKQYIPVSDLEYNQVCSSWKQSIKMPFGSALCNEDPFPLVFGTFLPDENSFTIGSKSFTIISEKKDTDQFSFAEIIQNYKGTPYLWGGRSPLGIDCSGFVQNVFKIKGVALKRDASQQVLQGIEVRTIDAVQAYDLLFFSNEVNKIIHVGIFLGNNQIIHSSGQVRIDLIDAKGIFNRDTHTYSHTLHSIRRVL